jgi:hypothetical protein
VLVYLDMFRNIYWKRGHFATAPFCLCFCEIASETDSSEGVLPTALGGSLSLLRPLCL